MSDDLGDRCPRCDAEWGDHSAPMLAACDHDDGPIPCIACWEAGYDAQMAAGLLCPSPAVDWRARTLAAEKKAEQYERDWYDAKSEFGTAMAKMREQLRTAEADRDVAESRKADAFLRLRERAEKAEARVVALEAALREVRKAIGYHYRCDEFCRGCNAERQIDDALAGKEP